MNKISIKQSELLNKIFIPFKERYPELTLSNFVLKFSKKPIDELTHRDFYFLINKVNAGYDYWKIIEKENVRLLKPNFNKLKYIIETENDDYIIGTQYHYNDYLKTHITDSLKIIAFKYLMILDYDVVCIPSSNINSKTSLLSDITDILSKTDYSFLIYETKNGYHAYNISKRFPFYEQNSYQHMHNLKCDNWYINFTKYVGYVTRLEKKKENNIVRDEEFIEKFILQINPHLYIDVKLKSLVDIKDNLI